MSFFSAGAGEWDSGVGAADTWTDGAEAGANSGHNFGATNGEVTQNGGEAGGDFMCRRCGEAGHMARQCPTAPAGSGNDGKCFNCGEEGHSKADCPNPRVFKGTCRICEKEGHPASECPNKPPPKCFNCKQEGHQTVECTANRVFDTSLVADRSADDAWVALEKADEERDLDDFREAFKVYTKAASDATYDELEMAFRAQNFQTYLIATENELPKTHTYINLQGELDKTFKVGFHLSSKPKRETAKQGWPETPEENLERLKDAGLPMERGIPKCNRCDELGHTTRACPEEAVENTDKVQVKCVNCDEVGHRARDCPAPRVDKFACRNCKQSGHTAAECTEPRSAEGVECRKCNQIGHFSRDCPTGGGNNCRNCGEEGHMSKECDKPRNPATVTCRNCEEMGHFSRDCPKPRDYSKVKCSNCDQMGHTKARCKEPIKEVDDGGFGAGGDTGGFDAPAGGDDFAAPATGGGDAWAARSGGATGDWGTAPAATTVGGGGQDGW
ncbi:MAG: hypothetical protein Q9175_006028 [Cornicularia normoerica]